MPRERDVEDNPLDDDRFEADLDRDEDADYGEERPEALAQDEDDEDEVEDEADKPLEPAPLRSALDPSAANARDQALLQGIIAGDTSALAALYDQYHRLVYSLALRVLNEPGAAEEVTQDVFLNVWRAANTYQPVRGRVLTWLGQITRNRAIDELRRRQGHGQELDTELNLELAETTPENPLDVDIEENKDALARYQAVSRALDQLPPAQREVIEMAYFNGLTQSEMAARLGEPLGTIKTRIRLGMQKLKSILGRDLSLTA